MLRFLLPCLAVSCFLLPSCGSPGAAMPEDSVAPSGQSLLWRIDGNGLEQPSYLFGTMHLIPEDRFEMGDHLKQVITSANQFVFEIDLKQEATLEIMMGTFLPNDTTLEMLLGKESLDSLQTFILDSLGFSKLEWMSFQRMRPIYLSQVMLLRLMDEALMSFELEFKKLADSLEIPILGLETIQEQMDILNSIPLHRQSEMLMMTIREWDSSADDFNKLVDFYVAQELDSLYYLMHEQFDDMMEFSPDLLDKRNERWIPIIEKMAAETRTFVAVGAGHLPGENGVLQLLRNKGYILTPVLTD